jgi:NADH:ubiquinone oxidoreductase subunit 5 (subunit L)/multisubunit Na+/H+ antiporter MnhA subunit
MLRDRILKGLLIVVGLLFTAGIYPLFVFFSSEPALSMMLSLYVTLGILLLAAVRDPAANRSLIVFTAWSSLAHALVMGTQAYRHIVEHQEVPGVILLAIIGVALLALNPEKPLPLESRHPQ